MKHIVIGASGYLGNTVYKKLRNDCSEAVYGTYCDNCAPDLIRLNLVDKSDIRKIMDLKPDTITWCACNRENEIKMARTGLLECIKNLPDNVRFVYVSTMIGTGKGQNENIIPRRRSEAEYLSNYINGKIEGESIVRMHRNHVIVRPGSIYGFDCDGHSDLRMKRLLAAANNGESYLRAANMYTSYVNIIDLSNAIIELENSSFTGTINISGESPVSYFSFYKFLAKFMHIDENCIATEYRQQAIYNTFDNSLRKNILKASISEIL